jgi:hypothetical protein
VSLPNKVPSRCFANNVSNNLSWHDVAVMYLGLSMLTFGIASSIMTSSVEDWSWAGLVIMHYS